MLLSVWPTAAAVPQKRTLPHTEQTKPLSKTPLKNIQPLQINHQLDATISPFYYHDVYLQLNMFLASSLHHEELNNCSSSLWFYLRSVVIAVLLLVVGPAGRPDHDQQHCYCHVPKVKPEAATAVVGHLMLDMRTPETC